jgi:hypothetical protein
MGQLPAAADKLPVGSTAGLLLHMHCSRLLAPLPTFLRLPCTDTSAPMLLRMLSADHTL